MMRFLRPVTIFVCCALLLFGDSFGGLGYPKRYYSLGPITGGTSEVDTNFTTAAVAGTYQFNGYAELHVAGSAGTASICVRYSNQDQASITKCSATFSATASLGTDTALTWVLTVTAGTTIICIYNPSSVTGSANIQNWCTLTRLA